MPGPSQDSNAPRAEAKSGAETRPAELRSIEARFEAAGLPETRPLETWRSTVVPPLDELQHGVRASSAPGRAESPLEIGETIGEGGMAIVRRAVQPRLQREVAVKTVRGDRGDEATERQLLREARLTGALEHPNIVPVHDLVFGDDGAPQLVLKRIEGVVWSHVMHDEVALEKRFGVQNVLEWNLRVLRQVCNAVHFANSRGVLHRDLKPDNVMIGDFGEVYVMDWGIALRLQEGQETAASGKALAGTPAYMAPDMLGAYPQSARTDVYLLGGLLYEIVTGNPPHRGTHRMQIIHSVLSSPPPIPNTVPRGLTAILRRAMALAPVDRWSDAEALRSALERFASDHDAARVAGRAEASRDALISLLEEPESAPWEPAVALFRECRQGYGQALSLHPEYRLARTSLRETSIQMIELALVRDEVESAQLWLGEMEEVPEALAARVDQAVEERRRRGARLEKIASLHDPDIGARVRRRLAFVVGVLWVLAPGAAQLAALYGRPPSHLDALLVTGAVFLVGVAAGPFLKTRFGITRFNRALARSAMTAIGASLFLHATDWLAGAPWQSTARSQLVAWAVVAAVLAIVFDARLWLVAGAYAAGVLVQVYRPDAVFVVMTVGNFIAMACFLRIWGGKEPPSAALSDS